MTQRRPVAFLTPEEIATRDPGIPVAVHYPAPDVFAERAARLEELAESGHPLAGFLSLLGRLARIQQQLLDQPRPAAQPDPLKASPLEPVAGTFADEAPGEAADPAPAPAPYEAPYEVLPQGPHEGPYEAPAFAVASDEAAGPPFDRLQPRMLAGWRHELRGLLGSLASGEDGLAALPAATTAALARLADADDDWLDRQASQRLSGLLRGGGDGLDAAAAPFIAAALQVHWTRAVSGWLAQAQGQAPQRTLARVDDGRACPCCASRPVASLVRLGSQDGGSRYLVCGLCQSQWHWVRIRCSHCGSTAGIRYQGLEAAAGQADPAAGKGEANLPGPGGQGESGQGASGQGESAQGSSGQRTAGQAGAVQIETCDTCRHYLKIVDRTRDHRVEPLADDLATLGLDLLASEAGWLRHGDNPLLLLGDTVTDGAEVADEAEARPPPERRR